MRFNFCFSDVDNFVLARAPRNFKAQSKSTAPGQRFTINPLKAAEFRRFQKCLESGWGSGAPIGNPRKSLDSTQDFGDLLGIVQTTGFRSYKIDYIRLRHAN